MIGERFNYSEEKLDTFQTLPEALDPFLISTEKYIELYFQSFKDSYESSQMFCFRTQCIQNKTFEMPCTRPRTRLMTRNPTIFNITWWDDGSIEQ